jgi:hypothetical protein
MADTFKIQPGATQYFLEQVGTSLHVGICFRGNNHPDMMEIFEGVRMLNALDALKDAGFTVRIHRDNKGHGIKDIPTRIDFQLEATGEWTIRKYPKNWTAATRPIETKTLTEAEVIKAMEWCKAHDWQVREFPGGARAWKGEVLPVRDAYMVKSLRRKIDENMRRYGTDPRRTFDLAFDCFDN